MAGAEPTRDDRQRASKILDELTFGGHSQDGAINVLAEALLAERVQNSLVIAARLRSPRILQKALTDNNGIQEATLRSALVSAADVISQEAGT